MKLAAYLAAEPAPKGDATLVERETGTPTQAGVSVWDLYTDDGRYFFSRTEAGLPAQVRENDTQGDGWAGREVAAAIYAVKGNLDTAKLKMAWPYATAAPTFSSALIEDGAVWENCEDALVAGSGNPQVRAGVLRLLSALPDIILTHGTADGQPTLTLTAGAAELGHSTTGRAAKVRPRLGSRSTTRRSRSTPTPASRSGSPSKPNGQGRQHHHLHGDPGQPGGHRGRQVLTAPGTRPPGLSRT